MKQLLKQLKTKLSPRLYNNKKLLLAFEYGLILSETARGMEKVVSPEIIKRMEKIILKEFHKKNSTQIACDMLPNILASFETN